MKKSNKKKKRLPSSNCVNKLMLCIWQRNLCWITPALQAMPFFSQHAKWQLGFHLTKLSHTHTLTIFLLLKKVMRAETPQKCWDYLGHWEPSSSNRPQQELPCPFKGLSCWRLWEMWNCIGICIVDRQKSWYFFFLVLNVQWLSNSNWVFYNNQA